MSHVPTEPALSAGRFVAHVDTLVLEVRLDKTTQPQHLCPRLPLAWFTNGKPPFAEAVDGGSSRTSDRFIIRIQDPAPVPVLRAQLAEIPGYVDAVITRIDVALDWYPNNQSDKPAMAAVAARMIGGVVDLDKNIRAASKKTGNVETQILYRDDLIKQILIRTAYRGNRDSVREKPADTIYAKAYLKSDEGGNYARFELSLIGVDLPARTLDELDTLAWTQLTKYFRFRAEDPLKPRPQFLRGPLAVTGAKHFLHTETRQKNGRKVYQRRTIADAELNRAAVLALRRLDRQRRKTTPKRLRS